MTTTIAPAAMRPATAVRAAQKPAPTHAARPAARPAPKGVGAGTLWAVWICSAAVMLTLALR